MNELGPQGMYPGWFQEMWCAPVSAFFVHEDFLGGNLKRVWGVEGRTIGLL
jgi:hypothetical protein